MRFVIRGTSFSMTPADVLDATRGAEPQPVDGRHRYFVRLHERRYPIKQILRLVTGLPAAGFGAQDAHRVLSRLGFRIDQRPTGAASPEAARPVLERRSLPAPAQAVGEAAGDYRSELRLLVVFETDEDGWVVASCPTLPGCHSQGRTREEALDNVREAIRGYLASMREHDAPLPGSTEFQVVEVRA